MLRNIICMALYEIVVLLIMLLYRPIIFFPRDYEENELYLCIDGEDISDSENKNNCQLILNTMIFHTFVMMQIFNEINCRRIKTKQLIMCENLFNNWKFICVVILTVVVQYALVQSGLKVLNTYPLNLMEHIVSLLLAANIFTWNVICKFFIPESIFAWIKFDERVH